MMPTRRLVIFGLLGAVAAPAIARASTAVDGGLAFGSTWRIVTDAGVDLSRLRPRIEAAIERVDRQMSPYRADSDLSRFNRAATTGWQPMPGALCRVAAQSLSVAALTGGAFDPTVGPIVSRMGFGPISGGAGRHTGLAARPAELAQGGVTDAAPAVLVHQTG